MPAMVAAIGTVGCSQSTLVCCCQVSQHSPIRMQLGNCSTSRSPGFPGQLPYTSLSKSFHSYSSSIRVSSFLPLSEVPTEIVSNPTKSVSSRLFIGSGGSLLVSAGAFAAAAAEGQASEGGEPATDYVLVFLFGAALVGLIVLTGGVIYLSVSEFLEKRQMTEQQKALAKDEFDQTESVKVGGPKGFGSKKVVEKKTDKGK